ncbi:MAG: GNAT family N-acetyltransferase [Planifilum fimeticola]
MGIAGFVRQTLIKTRHRGHVWGVHVRPDYQGKGVATRMMEALITRESPSRAGDHHSHCGVQKPSGQSPV